MRMPRLLSTLLIVPAFGALAAVPAGAESLTVEPVRVADRKAVFATVESVDQAAARTRLGGTLVELAIDEGSAVARGARLALVEDPKLALEMRAVEARIQSLQAQRALARTELDRIAELRRSGTVAQARLDQAQTNLDVVDRALAAVRAEKSVLSQQQAEGVVLAPAEGRVLQVHVTEGTVVLPGETVATIAAERYILRLHLPERHARFIGEGDAVAVGARGLAGPAAEEGRLRQGRIRQVYPEMQQGRVVADVEVAGLGDFFVGERVPVYVDTGIRETIVLPPAYLFERFGVSFVRLEDGREAVVQPGLPAEGGIEILSGLRPGDVLLEAEAQR